MRKAAILDIRHEAGRQDLVDIVRWSRRRRMLMSLHTDRKASILRTAAKTATVGAVLASRNGHYVLLVEVARSLICQLLN